jgi:hypothetical protein
MTRAKKAKFPKYVIDMITLEEVRPTLLEEMGKKMLTH